MRFGGFAAHASVTTDSMTKETHGGERVPRHDRIVDPADDPVMIMCGGQGTRIRASGRLPFAGEGPEGDGPPVPCLDRDEPHVVQVWRRGTADA
jgi:hypothetical protein